MKTAHILLPLPIQKLFTYRIPDDLASIALPGQRVVVQFGGRKVQTGIIYQINEPSEVNFAIKDIIAILDINPIVTPLQFTFWEWLSSYYLCAVGEIMKTALPSALLLTGETKLQLNKEFDPNQFKLSDKEYLIYEALSLHTTISIADLQQIINQQSIVKFVDTLISIGMVIVEEELKSRYKPKIVKHIRLAPQYENSETALSELMDTLGRKTPRQLDLLLQYIQASRLLSDTPVAVEKKTLSAIDKNNNAIISSMVKKGIFIIEETKQSRLATYEKQQDPNDIHLSPQQTEALEAITNSFQTNNITLLKGVTGSGKTELYIKLIDHTLNQHQQALLLLPEIALTVQIVNRLKIYFGDKVIVCNSKFNDSERVEIWDAILNNKQGQLIIGSRSTVLMPFNNLGLIIVDEEHDQSYKQSDPSPRYNARDAAIYLSSLHKAKILLGSATPSIESYHNTQTGKYQLVELNQRFGNISMPETIIADLNTERKNKTMHTHLSSILFDHIQQALDQGEQIILFQNRRGFASYIQCNKCGWIHHCTTCDVTLTYHKTLRQMKCHYCGRTQNVPVKCEQCGSQDLSLKGFGTQKIEDELPILFPNAKIGRMDLDSTTTKYAHQDIIDNFEAHNIDILIGTQMITKGLNFTNVSLVGILNADNIINYPDFRSFERAFQIISQVSGRAGRQHKQGKVIIQTTQPYHSAIRYAMENNYIQMYQTQIDERQQYNYPPFTRLIKITIKSKDKPTLDKKSIELYNILRTLNLNILEPHEPLVPRINNLYISNIIIKMQRNTQLPKLKKQILQIVNDYSNSNKTLRIAIDVDPYTS